jgi:hypothetical protein
MSTPAFTMLTTLADDPRNNLPEWYLEIRTKARNLCSAHDAAGALGLIAQDVDWQQFPGVLTNPIDVAAGQAPNYRARPTFDYPTDHAANAAAAVISVYRQAIERHAAFTNASSLRMQHFGQNKEDFAYQVYLFRVATKGKSGGFI